MTTLLLIHDDVCVRRRLYIVLEADGYRVLLAANAVEGLSILRTVVVAAILCPLMLPGMPGVQFVHRVRRTPAWEGLPLVLMHLPHQAYLVPHHAITASLPMSCTAGALRTTLATALGQPRLAASR